MMNLDVPVSVGQTPLAAFDEFLLLGLYQSSKRRPPPP